MTIFLLPLYKYKIINQKGELIKGKIKKDNIDQVNLFMKANFYLPIEIRNSTFLLQTIFTLSDKFHKLSYFDLSIFCKELSFIMLSGYGIGDGMDIIIDRTKNIKLKEKLHIVKNSILKGETFERALKKVGCFPNLIINMVKSGEENGTIGIVLKNLSKYYLFMHATSKELRSTLIYPFVVLIFMIFAIILSIVRLIPEYIEIFLQNSIELPLYTKILINFSNFLQSNYLFLFSYVILFLFFINIFLKTKIGILLRDKILLNIPIYKKYYLTLINYRISEVLYMFIQSGSSIINCIEILKGVLDNKILSYEIERISIDIKNGILLSNSFQKCQYIDKILISMIKIGEETGFLAEALDNCSKYFEEDLQYIAKKSNKLIEPMITLILGVILIFVVLAILTPSFYLTDML